MESQDLQKKMQRVEVLIQELERLTDPAVKERSRELVQALLELHGAGLARIVEIVSQSGEPGHRIVEHLAEDDLTSSLLVLYGLHPVELGTRVRRALDQVRPNLRGHGCDAELLSVVDGTVRLRLHGGGESQSGSTVMRSLEEAIVAAAPDVTTIEIHANGEHGSRNVASCSRISLPLVGRMR